MGFREADVVENDVDPRFGVHANWDGYLRDLKVWRLKFKGYRFLIGQYCFGRRPRPISPLLMIGDKVRVKRKQDLLFATILKNVGYIF